MTDRQSILNRQMIGNTRKQSSSDSDVHVRKVLSKEHAFTILESIATGVFTVDIGLRVTYFNCFAEKITGIPAQEALGRHCSEVLRCECSENECTLRNSIETGKEAVERCQTISRKDGKRIPVNITTAVLRDRTGRVVGGVESFCDLSAVEELRKELRRSYTFEDIISKSHRIFRILDMLPHIAESDSTVLIQGPSGSGKELFARAIHNLSPRKQFPFVPVNCEALPDSLLESELFGYVKGAFTDARRDKPGRFSTAHDGTLFLDEIESLSVRTQVKLLRVLQDGEFQPLGATSPSKANVRIVAATREDLSGLVTTGRFRDDLLFRLDVVRIKLPPLAERREDIPLLTEHFVEVFNRKMSRTIKRVSGDALRVLMRFEYPGNIRQLENIIEHAFVMCRGTEIERKHLPPELLESSSFHTGDRPTESPLNNAEQKAIIEALENNRWNKIETANELRISRTTLWRKMRAYGLRAK